MVNKKYEWTNVDIVTSQVIQELLEQKHISLRQIEKLTDGKVAYSRMRDIITKRRAPVRLSEFFAICIAIHADPIKTFNRILHTADSLDAEQEHEQQINKLTSRTPEDLSTDMTLAANTDTNKKEESEYEDWGA
ncbi:hypothetical protein ACFQ1H_02405 [Scardovia wiggsiae]|mgnify:FL=1|uniref:hypothetical protein n=1 Tax=Scardovia wiggsiae TaxID=230143 RepID=UPI00363B9E7D